MWFLNFIPTEWLQLAIHATLALGILLSVVGFLAQRIVFLGSYGTAAKLVGNILFVVGVFFEGGYGVEMSWRAKVDAMQAKIQEAEKKSDEFNEKLDKAIKDKKVIIVQKVVENAKEIEKNRTIIDSECKLNDTAWLLYNRAVEPKVSKSTK